MSVAKWFERERYTVSATLGLGGLILLGLGLLVQLVGAICFLVGLSLGM